MHRGPTGTVGEKAATKNRINRYDHGIPLTCFLPPRLGLFGARTLEQSSVIRPFINNGLASRHAFSGEADARPDGLARG